MYDNHKKKFEYIKIFELWERKPFTVNKKYTVNGFFKVLYV